MEKKSYLLFVIGIIIIFLLCVLGNIITVGDKLMSASAILGWTFYVLVAVMFYVLIIRPML